MRLMGASTKKETVNGPLRDYVARVKRLEAAAKPAARGEQDEPAARGEFEAATAAHAAAERVRRAAIECSRTYSTRLPCGTSCALRLRPASPSDCG